MKPLCLGNRGARGATSARSLEIPRGLVLGCLHFLVPKTGSANYPWRLSGPLGYMNRWHGVREPSQLAGSRSRPVVADREPQDHPTHPRVRAVRSNRTRKTAAKTNSRSSRGFRLLSAYTLSNRTKLWVITEADRSATTLLLQI